MYYVYILLEKQSATNYIGYSSNLRQRIKDHKNGLAAKVTRNGKWELIYYEAYLEKADATMREYRLKHDGRARKQLVNRISHSISAWLK